MYHNLCTHASYEYKEPDLTYIIEATSESLIFAQRSLVILEKHHLSGHNQRGVDFLYLSPQDLKMGTDYFLAFSRIRVIREVKHLHQEYSKK